MADPEHVKILRKGAYVWNQWRKTNPGVTPDFHEADLGGAGLARADLGGADLVRADLSAAFLSAADLTAANLHMADLGGWRRPFFSGRLAQALPSGACAG
jgi:uncharacterized protein YjbI with pentapeptide repeats